jgi:hypothetical protein
MPMRQFDAVVRRDFAVPFGYSPLHLYRAPHRVNDAGKLDQQTVDGGLDDAAMVLGDLWIDDLAAQRFEAFERAFLVRPHQPRIPRHIGGEDRGETADARHLDPRLVDVSRLTQNRRHCSSSAADCGGPLINLPEP